MTAVLSLYKGVIKARGRFHLPERVVSRVLADVAARHDVTPTLILSKSLKRYVAHARQEAMFLLRSETDAAGEPMYSFPTIARALGLRDHTAVIHGVRRHKARTAPIEPNTEMAA